MSEAIFSVICHGLDRNNYTRQSSVDIHRGINARYYQDQRFIGNSGSLDIKTFRIAKVNLSAELAIAHESKATVELYQQQV
uniref:Type VI secretion system tip protein VgrG n=1 Tax=Heterorhabditis bacteriophora TaxID=37862 RepID=A0A1I7WCT6_HETBA